MERDRKIEISHRLGHAKECQSVEIQGKNSQSAQLISIALIFHFIRRKMKNQYKVDGLDGLVSPGAGGVWR